MNKCVTLIAGVILAVASYGLAATVNITGQNGWYQGWNGPINVTTDNHASGNASLVFGVVEGISNTAPTTVCPLITNGIVTVSANMYCPSSTTAGEFIFGFGSDSDWVNSANIIGSANGIQNGLGDGAASYSIVTDQWIPMKFVVDLSSDTNNGTFYYNNVAVGAFSYLSDGGGNPAVAGVKYAWFNVGNDYVGSGIVNGPCYFDDVVIRQGSAVIWSDNFDSYISTALAADAGPDHFVSPVTPSVKIGNFQPFSPPTVPGGSLTAIGGTPPYTYSCTPATGLSSATAANPTASPNSTTTYTVTVTDSTNGTATTSVKVSYLVPDPGLISAEFVSFSTPADAPGRGVVVSGDTTPTGRAKNGDGLMFTTQIGPWNAFNMDPRLVGNYTYTTGTLSGFLTNAAGTVTTIQFAFTSGYRCYLGDYGLIGYLRNVCAQCDSNQGTPNPVTWQITGLVPNGVYELALFSSPGGTYVANGVGGVSDSDGDANWSSLQADGSGTISGSVTGTPGQPVSMYGFQLESIVPFWIPSLSQPGGVPTFTIPNSVLSSHYTLVYKTNLTDSSWTALTGSGTAIGTGGTLTLSDPTPVGSQAHRFYRLQRNP